MKKCLIFVGKENFQDAVDLMGVVDCLYGRKNTLIYGFGDLESLEYLKGYYDILIKVEELQDSKHDMENDMINLTNCMEELHRTYNFDSILISANYIGRMLAPRLAMRLRTGLVADVTAIQSEGEGVELIRPAYSGKLMAAIKNCGNGPLMMTVRQKVFRWTASRDVNSEWQEFSFHNMEPPQIKMTHGKRQENSEDIRESEVLVAGGGGAVKYFDELQALAEELQGKVAASRKIIDRELAPRTIQVGQSGKTISPKLYIAIGISGAIQHIEGLKNLEHVIAVNKKKQAPICSIADVIVEGDGKEFINKLLLRIRKSH